MLDLPPSYLSLIRELLTKHVPHAEVWAYGSRVNGDSYAASDLDLVIRHPHDLTQTTPQLPALREAFIESNLPIQVQIVDWAYIPESFHREIESGYEIIKTS
jgi:predicted nucleotidyltransferase